MTTKHPTTTSTSAQQPEPDPAADSCNTIRALQNSATRQSPPSQERWASLKEKYDAELIQYARSNLGKDLARHCDPEDIVCEAWMRVYEKWDIFEYNRKHALKAWLKMQVDRVILDKVRKIRRRPSEMSPNDLGTTSTPPDFTADQAGPATNAGLADRKRKLLDAISKIPLIYRRVLHAVYIEEKPREQVAEELGVKANTLTVQLKRGKELLREILGEETF